MDKEKAEDLVDSLIDAACDVGYSGYYGGMGKDGLSHHLQIIARRDRLRDEIISYLVGERKDK